MIYTSNEIERFKYSKQKSSFSAINFEEKTYAAHMGFFISVGLAFGKKQGEATGSNTYLPISFINVSDLEFEASENASHISDIIEKKSNELAKILTRLQEGDIVDILAFSIREIFRNVVEHSFSEKINYCAQYWPNQHRVEVAILDTGIGIKESISHNPNLSLINERDAIHFALMPGISKIHKSSMKQDQYNPWINSGYGLYMTNRICRNGGTFSIISNNAGLILDENQKRDLTCNYIGTALRLCIDTKKITSCSQLLNTFSREGSEIARGIKSLETLDPSIASTMLSRDFSKE
jgi:hypothetical protein